MNPQHRYSRYFTYIQPVFRDPVVRTYGSIILTIIAIAVFILFAIKPTIETILVLQKKLENSKEVLQKTTQKSQDLSQARKNFEVLDINVKQKIQNAIPGILTLKTLTATLEQNAILNQASISALQIQPVSITATSSSLTHKDLSEIQFVFNIEGSYDKLINVLKGISFSSRLISITNLVLNKEPESTSILMTVTGKAFFLK